MPLKEKITREIARFRRRISARASLEQDGIEADEYDRNRSELIKSWVGKHAPDTGKIAVFLIFQPQRIAPSTLRTCDYLWQNGYAPIVVSNCPVSDPDRENLLAHCAHLLVRPNIGHDFGGYRDGLWFVEQQNIRPARLILLNDSVWFPAFEPCDFLQHLEDLPDDFLGGYEMKRRPLSSYRTLLPSYFLMFKKAAIESETFRNFWKGYVQSSDIPKTVRRGEHGLSRAMHKGGIRARGFITKRDVKKTIGLMSDPDEIAKAVQYVNLAIPEIGPAVQRLEKAPSEGALRSEAEHALLKLSATRTFTNTLPVMAIEGFKFPFVKKREAYKDLHRLILAAQRNGDLPDAEPCMIEEIAQRLEP